MQIYLITNRLNGKIYVGKWQRRRDLGERWKLHVIRAACGNAPIQRAIRAFGPAAFEISTLHRNITEPGELSMWERIYIAALDSTNPNRGYNVCTGGPGTPGLRHSEETKEKIRAWGRGKPKPAGFGAKVAAANHLRVVRPDTREKIRAKLLGSHRSDETRAKISMSHRGLRQSEEHRKRSAEARRGTHLSTETRAKIATALRGKKNHLGCHHSAETIEKIRAAALRQPRNHGKYSK